jgi:hypothetical protein
VTGLAILLLLFLQTLATGALWRESLGLAAMDWIPWLILAPGVIWLGQRLQINARTWAWALPLHVAIGLSIAFFLGLLAVQALRAGLVEFPPKAFFVSDPSLVIRPSMHEMIFRSVIARFAFPIYAVLIAATHALTYHQNSLDRERRALLAEAHALESRLLALQMQLNPHFLFNALNAVSSFIPQNPRQADAMLCSVCDLLRCVLDSGNKREVTLADELSLVERYLDIQRIRFADRLTITYDIAPDTRDAAVPTLLLQPLVENAIVHGIAPHARPGLVTVRARRHGQRLRLEISDDGPSSPSLSSPTPAPPSPLAAPRAACVGLENTRARLAALHGNDQSFTLRTGPSGAIAVVEFPFQALAS